MLLIWVSLLGWGKGEGHSWEWDHVFNSGCGGYLSVFWFFLVMGWREGDRGRYGSLVAGRANGGKGG